MSVYEQIGGSAPVQAAVDLFYEKVTADGRLAPWFEGVDMRRLKAHQRAFIGAALGGPDTYRGRDMGAAHAGLGITPDAFGAVVGHLVAALEELGVDGGTVGVIVETLAPLEAQIVDPASADV